jgi:predicted metal-dependent peptidase
MVHDKSIPTAAVDSSWRMYFNDEFLDRAGVEAGAAVMEHELWHLLRRHGERARKLNVPRDLAKVWNFAADAEIHSDDTLVKRLKEIPGFEPITPESFNFEKGLLAEEYYEMLLEAPKGDVFGETPDGDVKVYKRTIIKVKKPGKEPPPEPPQEGEEDEPPPVGPPPDPVIVYEYEEPWTGERPPGTKPPYVIYDPRLPQEGEEGVGERGQPVEGEGDFEEGEGEGEGEGKSAEDKYDEGEQVEQGQTTGGEPSSTPHVGEGDCGSSATGIPAPWEDEPDDFVDRSQEDFIRKKTADKVIEESATGRGTGVGSTIVQWAEEELSPSAVNWQQQLRSAVSNAINFVAGSFEFSRRRVSRRQWHQKDILLPGLVHPVPEVAIIIDVSASMFSKFKEGSAKAKGNYTLLEQAMGEVAEIVRQFGSTIGVSVFATDTTVSWTGRIFNPSDIQKYLSEAKIGGGTDLTVGMNAAYHSQPRPNIMVVLTDGGTLWPDSPPPNMRVVIGIVGSDEAQMERWGGIPPFGDVIYITSGK